MLIACGERGYPTVTIPDLLTRADVDRDRFYRLYSGKEECYASAHEAAVAQLIPLMLGAAGDGEWRSCLRGSLRELARFVVEQPLLARGLLVEVRVAGGSALSAHSAAIERLVGAVDSARHEAGPDPHLSPLTAEFIVRAVEASLVFSLERGEPEGFAAAIPELGRLAVGPYFGDEAAHAIHAELEA